MPTPPPCVCSSDKQTVSSWGRDERFSGQSFQKSRTWEGKPSLGRGESQLSSGYSLSVLDDAPRWREGWSLIHEVMQSRQGTSYCGSHTGSGDFSHPRKDSPPPESIDFQA